LDVVMSHIDIAAETYGQAVLTTAEDMAAVGTVRLAQRLLARLRRSKSAGRQIESAVGDLANHPGDDDFRAALRAQIRKAFEVDPELEIDLVTLLKAGGVVFTASAPGAVTVESNHGIISTGDNAVNQIQGRGGS
jgi:hypothetical protein